MVLGRPGLEQRGQDEVSARAPTPNSEAVQRDVGYLVGAGIMLIGGTVRWVIGIDAEDKSLESDHQTAPLAG